MDSVLMARSSWYMGGMAAMAVMVSPNAVINKGDYHEYKIAFRA